MCLRRSILLLSGAMPLAGMLSSNAQAQWTHEQYTGDGQGSPGAVHVLGFNEQGRLFIGSERGLFISDGNGIRHPARMPIPENTPIHALVALDDGGFIVAPRGQGIMHMDAQGTTIKMVPAPCDPPNRTLRAERFDISAAMDVLCAPHTDHTGRGTRALLLPDGRTVMSTGGELLFLSNGQVVQRAKLPGDHAHGLALLDRSLHVYSDGTLFRIPHDGGPAQRVDITWPGDPAGPAGNAGGMFWHAGSDTALVERHGRLWAMYHHGGNVSVEDLGIRLPAGSRVNDACWRPKDGLLVLGMDQGLWIHHRAMLHTVSCRFPDEQRSMHLFTQLEWNDGGVLTMSRDRMTRSVVMHEDRCLPGPPEMGSFNTAGLIRDQRGRVLFGRGDALYRFDPATGREVLLSNVAGSPPVFHKEHDTIWVAAQVGIGKIVGEGMEWTDLALNQILGGRPTCIHRDDSGRLLIGGRTDIIIADPLTGAYKPFLGAAVPYVTSITPAGGMWFLTTYGYGVHVSDGKASTRQLPMDPLTHLMHAHAIMPDASGWWWISTNNSMIRVREQDVLRWTSDTSTVVHYAYYSDRSGAGRLEYNGGGSPPFIRLKNGKASFPTSAGLVQFTPDSIASPWPRYPIVLDHVMANDSYVQDTAFVRLSQNDAVLEVGFSVAHWGEPFNVRFEYAISDKPGWTPIPMGDRVLRLQDLPYGRHKLIIRKAMGGNDHPLVLSFTVPRPLYYRPWFILSCIVAGAGLFLLTTRLHTARLRGRNLELERKVRARTNELVVTNQELHRSLRAKELLVSILSHDVVTPLRFVAHVANDAAGAIGSERKEKDPVWPMVRDLAQATDKLQANARELLRWIKHQDSRLKPRWKEINLNQMAGRTLRMIEEQAARQGTELVNNVPEDHMVRTDPNMFSVVLTNLVNNAIVHTREGSITMDAALEGDEHVITIRDTGAGMSTATMEHVQRLRDHGSIAAMQDHGEREVQGLGYIILTDLLRLLNGRFDVVSGPNEGTVVTLFLPVVPGK